MKQSGVLNLPFTGSNDSFFLKFNAQESCFLHFLPLQKTAGPPVVWSKHDDQQSLLNATITCPNYYRDYTPGAEGKLLSDAVVETQRGRFGPREASKVTFLS